MRGLHLLLLHDHRCRHHRYSTTTNTLLKTNTIERTSTFHNNTHTHTHTCTSAMQVFISLVLLVISLVLCNTRCFVWYARHLWGATRAAITYTHETSQRTTQTARLQRRPYTVIHRNPRLLFQQPSRFCTFSLFFPFCHLPGNRQPSLCMESEQRARGTAKMWKRT
jgi:hypothetical protein